MSRRGNFLASGDESCGSNMSNNVLRGGGGGVGGGGNGSPAPARQSSYSHMPSWAMNVNNGHHSNLLHHHQQVTQLLGLNTRPVDILSQEGRLNAANPPVSQQRRHSKLNLRITPEMSMDHGAESITFGTNNSSSSSSSSSNRLLSSNLVPGLGGNSISTKTSAGAATTSAPLAATPSATGSSANDSTTSKNGNNRQATPKERYRIVIMGSSAVGKTAIVEQFLYGSFPATHCATVEELHKGEYEVAGGGFIPLEILDTSGSFEFPAMRRLAISTGDAFALIYSIDSMESFEEIKNIREMIMQVKKDAAPPIVVVGNKMDLEEKRQVQLELAECLCIDWEHGFVECSAKNNKNIVNIFSCMLLQARLKGSLNVLQLSQTHSPSRHIGYKEHGEHSRRRRSSLPISELFHRRPTNRFDVAGTTLAAAAAAQQKSSGATFRKRNSCNPS